MCVYIPHSFSGTINLRFLSLCWLLTVLPLSRGIVCNADENRTTIGLLWCSRRFFSQAPSKAFEGKLQNRLKDVIPFSKVPAVQRRWSLRLPSTFCGRSREIR